MDQTDKIGSIYLDELEWYLALGQLWQTLGFLQILALYRSQFIGGAETAVSILSFVYHHPDALYNYRRHREEIQDIHAKYKAALKAEVYMAAWQKGKEMDFKTAVSIVRSALSSEKVA